MSENPISAAAAATFDGIGGWAGILHRLTEGGSLTADEAGSALSVILAGEASDAQMAAFAIALRMKGETAEEMTGLVRAWLGAAVPVPDLPPEIAARVLDTCGTGGDRSGSVNVSTMAALVVAGAGVPVAKHGNRAASSKAGSADVLEALGVRLDIPGEAVNACIVEAGMGFYFAQSFHPALRHLGPVRRALGVATIFNVLGPLANPARPRRQLLGIADPRIAERMLHVLHANGAERAIIVHGADGLDELSLSGTSTMWHLRSDSTIVAEEVSPNALGLALVDASAIAGGDATRNAEAVRSVLRGDAGPVRDIVRLNAAAALVVAGEAADLAGGLEIAAASIDTGAAAQVLDRLVETSNA